MAVSGWDLFAIFVGGLFVGGVMVAWLLDP